MKKRVISILLFTLALTLIIVGSRETRVVTREGQTPLVYTPRMAAPVSA